MDVFDSASKTSEAKRSSFFAASFLLTRRAPTHRATRTRNIATEARSAIHQLGVRSSVARMS